MRNYLLALALAGTAASAQPAPLQLDAAAAQAIVAGCVRHATSLHHS
jgi:hypothetical protein